MNFPMAVFTQVEKNPKIYVDHTHTHTHTNNQSNPEKEQSR